MQAERYVRDSGYVVDQMKSDVASVKHLVMAVFAGMLLLVAGLGVMPVESTPLLVKVMGLLSLSIAMGAVGTYLGRNLSGWLPVIGLMALTMIGMFIVRAAGGSVLGVGLLMGWSIIPGMMLGPLVSFAIDEEGPGVVLQALIGTTTVLMITGFVTLVTGINLSALAPLLLVAVIGLVIFSLVGMFVRFSRRVNMVYSIIGLVVFAGMFLLNFFRLSKDENTWDAAVSHTIGLYLNFVNFFSFLLQFLLTSKRR